MTTTSRHTHVAPLRPRLTISDEDLDVIEGCIAVAPARYAADVAALEDELARATVVPRAELPPDAVRLGSTLVVEDLDSGTRRTISVVLPQHADVAAGRVSVLAPIGAAVIGLRAGDDIDWPLPRGTARVRVSEVSSSHAG